VVKKSILFIFLICLVLKIVCGYLPVEVIHAQYSELENTLEGEFLVLREEKVVTAPFRGRFVKVKEEGERVAKNAVIGYLEKVAGTSLEKKSSQPIKALSAGVISYHTDGWESICHPEMWAQLDLTKLDTLRDFKAKIVKTTSEKINPDVIEAGEGIFKITDNLAPCYFYLSGTGAYPEKIKKGSSVSIRLEKEQDHLLKGVVTELSRKTGSYSILLKINNVGSLNQNRQEKGEMIVCSYKGVVLPEKALVFKEGKYGVYLFQKGRAGWKEVERIAQLGGEVVLSGLMADDWIIADPHKVKEGKRVLRINK